MQAIPDAYIKGRGRSQKGYANVGGHILCLLAHWVTFSAASVLVSASIALCVHLSTSAALFLVATPGVNEAIHAVCMMMM